MASPVKKMVTGPEAFYEDNNYGLITLRDFTQTDALQKPAYSYNVAPKMRNFLFEAFHKLAGYPIVPSTFFSKKKYRDMRFQVAKNILLTDDDFKIKRISLKVNNILIDAIIVGKPSTFANKKWTIFSLGNAECYEDRLVNNGNRLIDHDIREILAQTNSNGIIFNYPGAGASKGGPDCDAMVKAYRAVLRMLEDEDNGIGAKEIIGIAHSIGGGVQGEALKNYPYQNGIKYILVYGRTFSSLDKQIKVMLGKLGKIAAPLANAFGWKMNTVESAARIAAHPNVHQVVLATADCARECGFYDRARSGSAFKFSNNQREVELIAPFDNVIRRDSSLATEVLTSFSLNNTTVIGIPEYHNSKIGLQTTRVLSDTINRNLDRMDDKSEKPGCMGRCLKRIAGAVSTVFHWFI